jgi:hypothetical protein
MTAPGSLNATTYQNLSSSLTPDPHHFHGLDTRSAIAVTEIVLYSILLLPTFWCAWIHGWRRSLGWIWLIAFMLVRIGVAADTIHNNQNGNKQARIQVNVTVCSAAGLILASQGFVWEA